MKASFVVFFCLALVFGLACALPSVADGGAPIPPIPPDSPPCDCSCLSGWSWLTCKIEAGQCCVSSDPIPQGPIINASLRRPTGCAAAYATSRAWPLA